MQKTEPTSATIPSIKPRYLSIKEAVVYSGLSRTFICDAIASSNDPLPSYKRGRRVLIDATELDGWIKQAAA